MTPEELALRLSRLLTESGVPHCLIGGLAVAAHGHPRATKDADFLIDVAATAPLIERAAELGLSVRPEHADFAEEGLVVLCTADAGDPAADLLVVDSDVERDIVARAAMVEIGDTRVPLVALEDLLALKLASDRAQDVADVEALLLRRKDTDRATLRARAAALGVEEKLTALLSNLEEA